MRADRLEWYNKLEKWEAKGTVLTLPISPSSKDGKTPLVNFGPLQIYLDVAWDAPIGSSREMAVRRTKSGRFYFVPTNPLNLPSIEYDTESPRLFSEMLKEDEKGQLFFRLPSGRILVPLNRRAWEDAGVRSFIGKEIELVGWPRKTCFVVMPRHGWAGLGQSTRLEPIEDSPTNRHQIEIEQSLGLVRVKTIDGQSILVFANTLLGIPADEELNENLIRKQKKTTLTANNPDQLKVIKIAGVELDAAGFVDAVGAATKVLKKLVKDGVETISSLENKTVEDSCHEDNHHEETVAVEQEICACPNCGVKNRYRPGHGPKSEARCGNCGTMLFPAAEPPPVDKEIPHKPTRERTPRARTHNKDEAEEEFLKCFSDEQLTKLNKLGYASPSEFVEEAEKDKKALADLIEMKTRQLSKAIGLAKTVISKNGLK